MHITEYFAQPMSETFNRQPQVSDWLDLCSLDIQSRALSIGDAVFFPSDQIEVIVKTGIYMVQAKVFDYGNERRVSRLRAFLPDSSFPLDEVGEISVDFAVVGVCDYSLFADALAAYDDNIEEFQRVYTDRLAPMFGVIDLTSVPPARMAFVSPGWGDGSYTVYALVSEVGHVGAEVVFIQENEDYPFAGVEEYQVLTR